MGAGLPSNTRSNTPHTLPLTPHVQVRTHGNSEEGIEFHWDMDEVAPPRLKGMTDPCMVQALIEATGFNVHPHLSTVSYISACGAPTLVCEKRTPVVYEELPDEAITMCFSCGC